MTFAIEGHSKTRYVVKQGPLNLSRKFLLQFSQTQNSEVKIKGYHYVTNFFEVQMQKHKEIDTTSSLIKWAITTFLLTTQLLCLLVISELFKCIFFKFIILILV